MKNENGYSILVFRTSIRGKKDVKRAASVLNEYSQITHWNVDLEDWEKVSRIESIGISSNEIANALKDIGIYAIELE